MDILFQDNTLIAYICFSLIGLILLLLVFRKFIQTILFIKERKTIIEIIPPATSDKLPLSTQQLFSVIHSLGMQRTILQRILGLENTFSCELVSTKNSGIRYLIKTNSQHSQNLKRSIISYLPGIQVNEVHDYLTFPDNSNGKPERVIEIGLSNTYLYPLKRQNSLEDYDPVAYITGMMTKLYEDEMISFQVLLTPVTSSYLRNIKRKLISNENVIDASQLHIASYVFNSISWVISTLVDDLNGTRHTQQPNKPISQLNDSQRNLMQLIESKADQPVFNTSIRIFIRMHSMDNLHERTSGFISSLGVFSTSHFQSLVKNNNFMLTLTRFNNFLFHKRLHSPHILSSNNILSVGEISDLYHFPFKRVTQTENIVKTYSRELPAPLSLKNSPNLDVSFAKNVYADQETAIGLTEEERKRHMYIIGATGSGKTTLITSMIWQDIEHGKGVCVVDPHGDLAESTLNFVPESRNNDLIYFNPFDIKYPIGVNLLELTHGLDPDELLLEKEFIAESVISLFRKVFSDAMASHPHRIEYILRNTIHTAFTVENATLFTLFDLLNNPPFQKSVIQKLTDENLINFWKYEFGMAGDYQKVKMVSPVTARIGRFLFSPSAKRILEQEKSTINFDEILDNKKILICNLSKGNIGEDTSEVMGIMILNKLQLAALRRARKQSKTREQFYLYVDEFQNFATPSFVQMLSESRKYGLNLILAEQSTSQQIEKSLTHIILANVGTVASFRSANPQDEDLMLRQFSPYVNRGDISNLPAYSFFMKKSALTPEEPFTGRTVVTSTNTPIHRIEELKKHSRANYAIEYIYKEPTRIHKKKNEKKITDANTNPIAPLLFPE